MKFLQVVLCSLLFSFSSIVFADQDLAFRSLSRHNRGSSRVRTVRRASPRVTRRTRPRVVRRTPRMVTRRVRARVRRVPPRTIRRVTPRIRRVRPRIRRVPSPRIRRIRPRIRRVPSPRIRRIPPRIRRVPLPRIRRIPRRIRRVPPRIRRLPPRIRRLRRPRFFRPRIRRVRFFPRPRPIPVRRRNRIFWRNYWRNWDAWYWRHHRYRRRFNWVIYAAGIVIPTAAIIAYSSGTTKYYVCQGYYGEGIYTGKVISNSCYVPYQGQVVVLKEYRILTGAGSQWIPASNGEVPEGAFAGGYEPDGTPIYVCRAHYKGAMHPGQVVGKGCQFAWKNEVIALSNYEVLVSS